MIYNQGRKWCILQLVLANFTDENNANDVKSLTENNHLYIHAGIRKAITVRSVFY